MSRHDDQADVPPVDGDVRDDARRVEITRMDLRGGGWIGYSEDDVYVVDGEDRVKVSKDAIDGLALRTLEFDIAVMSLLLIAVGGYVALKRNPLVGVGFGLVGLYSAYRTYQQRHELVIDVENEAKPISVYPAHPSECHSTLVEEVREY